MELYIHIPFCKRKCRYCSFVSFIGKETAAEAYVSLILLEAEKRRTEPEGRIDTVYIGGGTPSLLPANELNRMIEGLRPLLPMNSVSEFTIEANPGTVTENWLKTAHDSGINRISFGMQALQSNLLSILGRIHLFSDVIESVSSARKAGIIHINLDLMFGIPGQTFSDWCETLKAAADLCPDHISAYGLIPEENTPMFEDLKEHHLFLPDPELERDMYDYLIEFLSSIGYMQYEISNFSRPGSQCQHNIGYWTQIPYLGLGVSAVSMNMIRKGGHGMIYERSSNPCDLNSYRQSILNGTPESAKETISPSEARFETMMLGLRMNQGVDENRFMSIHGVSLEQVYGKKLSFFEKQKLMTHENGCWKMTRRGFDIQNSILVELMED